MCPGHASCTSRLQLHRFDDFMHQHRASARSTRVSTTPAPAVIQNLRQHLDVARKSLNVADLFPRSNKASGRFASDTLERDEQGTSWLINNRSSVLMCDVPHEAWDRCEAPARALAAPVVGVSEGCEGWSNRRSHSRLHGSDACANKGINAKVVIAHKLNGPKTAGRRL